MKKFLIIYITSLILISFSHAYSNKSNESEDSPTIVVKPTRLLIPIMEGGFKTEKIQISNTGNSTLLWSLELKKKDSLKNPERKTNIPKNESDSISYNWSDSDSQEGPSYRWRDIQESGKPVSGLKDDHVIGPFAIGFTFNFFNNNYQEFYISSNGFIGFGPIDKYTEGSNRTIPYEGAPNNIIAWCWDDLRPGNGAVYYQINHNELIIQFQDYQRYGSYSGKITSQVILKSCGNILYQYKSLTGGFKTNSCTVGIENNEGSQGVLVAYNKNYLHDDLAIIFSTSDCPWIQVLPSNSGSLLPGQTHELELFIDARNLIKGSYECELVINTNDTDKPIVEIPVTLSVLTFEPKLMVEADDMDITLMEGESLTKTIKVHNLGSGDLEWSMSIDHFSVGLNKSDNGDDDDYHVIDSDQLGGPIFKWIDISSTGNEIKDIKDDNYSGPFPIGFEFNYYNNKYSEFFVSSNGFIGFGPARDYQSRSNKPIPSEKTPNNILAWCWNDLKRSSGNVYWQKINQSLIIQFSNYGHYYGSGIVNAEIILKQNGSILYQYKSFENDFNTRESSVGIENDNGTRGVQVVYNNDYLHDNLAILFFHRSNKWIFAEPISGYLAPNESQSIKVFVNPQNANPGLYHGNIVINSNDHSQNPYTIPVKLDLEIAPPNITISPPGCDLSMTIGDIESCSLTIGNTGIGALNWKLSEITDESLKSPFNIINDKTQTKGGEDSFGYTWNDSDDEIGPVFSWLDISKTGVKVLDLTDDNHSGPYPIGFLFNYYGQNYSNFFIASNGFIGFGPTDRYNSRDNTELPSDSRPNNIIAWCWSDLNPENGEVFYETQDRRLIIQFKNYGQYNSKGAIDAEIILDQNGTILISYYRIVNGFVLDNCTLGIENIDGKHGVNVVTNNSYLHDSLTIRFINTKVPWFSVSPMSGIINPGESERMTITVDSGNLKPNNFKRNLIINNNDKKNNPLIVPVNVKISPSPPIITVSPEECRAQAVKGSITKCSLQIKNEGIGFLNWHISEVPSEDLSVFGTNVNRSDEEEYEWITSDESGGPDFNWIDISKTGSSVSGLSDDNFVGPFDIGFSFKYYGEIYNNFYIASNGYIGFGPEAGYNSRTNDPIGSDNPPNNILAWFWDDLNPKNASVYYKSDKMQLIVQFQNYNQYGNEGTIDSQIILKNNGTIFFQYINIKEAFVRNTGTVGIENKDGNKGVEVSYNNDFIHNDLSIRFNTNKKKWFSVAPHYGTMAPNEFEDITITINTSELNSSTYSETVSILSNDNLHSPFHIPVSIKVRDKPKPVLNISPKECNVTLRHGETSLCNFQINNSGNGILNWNLFNIIEDSNHNQANKLNSIFQSSYVTKKTQNIIINNTKKDPFEYRFIDSDQENGPIFSWFDISQIGKKVVGLGDDNNVGPFPIAFKFKYYGVEYNEFYISSNGYVGFGPPIQYQYRMNEPMPSSIYPNNIIAWLWDDLVIYSGGMVFYKTIDNNRLIIQFENYGQYESDGTVDAQVIINKNGTILLQYKEFKNNFIKNQASIGIENQTGSFGLQVAYNSDYLHENLAIHFRNNLSDWLTASPVIGTLMQDESIYITASINASNLKQNNYEDSLIIISNDDVSSPLNIPIKVNVLPPPSPIIVTSPEKCVLEVLQGSLGTCDLEISNEGDGDLLWNIINISNLSKNKTAFYKYPSNYYNSMFKGKHDFRIGKPVISNSGGPDNFGYFWTDNNEKNSPIFEWIDISNNGTKILDLQDDNFQGPFPIGFNFPFYGKEYSEFYVSSNGFIGFGPPLKYKERSHTPLPSTNDPNNIIAWCWKDLKPQKDSFVYYQNINNNLIVQFKNYGEYVGSDRINAEINLYLDGRIDIIYQSINNDFDKKNCTVGIENKDGSDGLLVSFNAEYLKNNLAIRFSPFPYCSWLAADPPSGFVKPGFSQAIVIKADATNLIPDSYHCSIVINTNDSNNKQVEHPVELTVLPFEDKALAKRNIHFSKDKTSKINKKVLFKSFKESGHKIAIQEVPPYSNKIKNLLGFVDPLFIDNYGILVCIYVNESWHIHSARNNKLIKINSSGQWVCDITECPYDHLATKIVVFLLPIEFIPPHDSNFKNIPMDLFKHSIDYIETFRYE